MKALLIVLLCLICVFAVLLCLRVHLQIVYNDKGIKLFFKIIGFSFCIYPTEKRKVKVEKADVSDNQQKTGGGLSQITTYINFGKSVFAKLRRKMTVDLLSSKIYVASSDPFKTAVLYGGMGAGVGVLLATLENIFIIKDKKICVTADFTSHNTRIFLDVKMSLTIAQLIPIAVFIVREFMKTQMISEEQG